MPRDRRVPVDSPVRHTGSQVGDSALVWHVIEDALSVVYAAESHLDDDFVALTDGQQHLAVLSSVWAGIMNGGIFEPLYNSGGKFLPEAIVAARAVGAEATARLFEGIVDVVGLSLTDVRDQDLRNEVISSGECDGDYQGLMSLLGPASGWFECAERFIDAHRDDFYV